MGWDEKQILYFLKILPQRDLISWHCTIRQQYKGGIYRDQHARVYTALSNKPVCMHVYVHAHTYIVVDPVPCGEMLHASSNQIIYSDIVLSCSSYTETTKILCGQLNVQYRDQVALVSTCIHHVPHRYTSDRSCDSTTNKHSTTCEITVYVKVKL